MITSENVQTYTDRERQISYDRIKRKDNALRLHMESNYPNSPKMPLEALQGLKLVLENKFLNDPSDEKVITLLEQVNEKITNEDYLKPDTIDMDYAEAYKNHAQQFVWPTAEETELQNQENQELENLKNSF